MFCHYKYHSLDIYVQKLSEDVAVIKVIFNSTNLPRNAVGEEKP